MANHRYHLRMPVDLWLRAARVARHEKVTMKTLINTAVTQYCERAERGIQ